MHHDTHDLPPFVRSWSRLYAIVIGGLLLEIVLFYTLMVWFS
ncbi:hypothetical protein [Nibrella viscosa]